jgi:hypothetical protein
MAEESLVLESNNREASMGISDPAANQPMIDSLGNPVSGNKPGFGWRSEGFYQAG